MHFVKRMSAGLLNFVVLLVLFVGSCAGPAVMYVQSPWWFLRGIDPGGTGSFFVAFRSKAGEVPQQVKVMRYRFDSDEKKYSDIQFQMPNGHFDYSFGRGEGSARINATAEDKGGQLIQVFVVGDTPWSSLSEYRVVDNKICPLRHAHSVAWLLLGAVILPFLIIPLAKPIRRGINRLMRIDPAG